MDGIHDLGGRQGYGPIDVGEPPEPFHAPWEARVLGIVRAFTRPANWSIDWFRHVRECIEPADYLTRPYYDQWLQTYAAMMIDSGAATLDELATGKSARAIPGMPPPMPPEKVATREEAHGPLRPRVERGPRLRRGRRGHDPQPWRPRPHPASAICARPARPDRGLPRLPRPPRYQYGRRRSGRAALYGVVSRRRPLAGSEGRRDRVYLDLWESYLERA